VDGLDNALTSQLEGRGVPVVLAIALLLGLRHAAEPDHLVAVSTLVASAREHRARLAARLGAAWGLGHAVTLLVCGLPVVLLHAAVPERVQQGAEMLVGVIIVALGVQLLHRWRLGAFHAHVHEHEGSRHAHLHAHAGGTAHRHEHRVRTARQAFGIGLIHGLAGSGAVTILLLAAIPSRPLAALALGVLAGGTAISMAVLSSALGTALGTERARRMLGAGLPTMGVLALAFGAWYALAAFV
jgi:ABC-type nickel/cobalt efflux system permease component RcnA